MRSAVCALVFCIFATPVARAQSLEPASIETIESEARLMGDLDGPPTRALLEGYLAPLLAQGADTLVLGCTHYPFLAPLLRELAGEDVAIIETGAAVARQLQRRLEREVRIGGKATAPVKAEMPRDVKATGVRNCVDETQRFRRQTIAKQPLHHLDGHLKIAAARTEIDCRIRGQGCVTYATRGPNQR